MVKVNQTSQNEPNKETQTSVEWHNEQSPEKTSDYITEGELEVRQRVFNHSPEYKKREIVFGQIQRIQTRLSNLEAKMDEILEIIKNNEQNRTD